MFSSKVVKYTLKILMHIVKILKHIRFHMKYTKGTKKCTLLISAHRKLLDLPLLQVHTSTHTHPQTRTHAHQHKQSYRTFLYSQQVFS